VVGLTGSAFAELGGWPGVLNHLVAGGSLDTGQAEVVLREVFGGAATSAQIAGLLVALRARGRPSRR